MEDASTSVTGLLRRAGAGDGSAREVLFDRVYAELKCLARAHMAREGARHTLQPTALVHEAYMKLVRLDDASFENRRQFYGLAARIMRGLLVDHARSKGAAKRGGGRVIPIETGMTLPCVSAQTIGVVDVGLAIEELAGIDEELATLAELRYLGGLEVGQIAEARGLAVRTVERRMRVANAWLRDHLGGD